jgi:hypothetical protein
MLLDHLQSLGTWGGVLTQPGNLMGDICSTPHSHAHARTLVISVQKRVEDMGGVEGFVQVYYMAILSVGTKCVYL